MRGAYRDAYADGNTIPRPERLGLVHPDRLVPFVPGAASRLRPDRGMVPYIGKRCHKARRKRQGE
jgi:hypothetical protein